MQTVPTEQSLLRPIQPQRNNRAFRDANFGPVYFGNFGAKVAYCIRCNAYVHS